MTVYSVKRPTQSWYGEAIGILILDASYPCVPGNVGNATTYAYPVRYQEVRGASIDRLLHKRDPGLCEAFIEAALELQRRGVKAITGACGFMAFFQEEVAAAVDVPVLLSSLMQIPFIHAMTGQPVGIITANSDCLTPKHLSSCRIDLSIPTVVAGMQGQTEFREAILEEKGTLDSAAIEAEVVEVASRLVSDHPDLGSILLECSDLPPYASAVQAATQRPVFDFVTMIDYVHAAVRRRPFSGFM
ncbi:aspartate/glutamate racemase family protein [Jiella sp. MQZ9-1]|uniref:Aspartate/glutamate racemase family protein n=1 Tax=Jiella flava TaxID=2816857 RepID=A0A939JY22_9HYPH|nr:aspartate/glutamate racemase family protein [Jiella flava]MBO0663966.1 aspartate/glutamate racemase family protein [Jiella flava]MCD2472537.1 aspartate/glutamate racemase family protein [Jiella flava]